MSSVLIALGLLVVAAWAGYLTADLRTLPATSSRADPPSPVSVVVPARDEEGNLPRLLRSLDAQEHPVAEVVVVDDDSADQTAAVARSAGARVISADPPPVGWTGKAWACWTGMHHTTHDLLLFLDADTELAPHALGALVEAHEQHGGLVSVQPFHRVVRPHEQLSAYFNLVAVMASSAFTGRPARTPMAFGPCLLTSRADLDRAGGHAAVRRDVLDDAALAAAYRRAGLPVWCAVGATDVRMRSYPDGLGQLVAGWTKNIASGASSASPAATLGTVAWVSAHHAVAVGAVVGTVSLLTGAGGAWLVGSPLLWILAYPALAFQVRSLLRRTGSFRWWTWLVFPVPLLAFDLVFARSAALTVVRRSVTWRGRDVDVRQHDTSEEAV
ncbi:glycosyltransferase [Nocardioides oleivorans]|uniref:Glycosyltransferase n=1 Tax=Nocardioides oleivorans TaxID=273676 RepID=A0A4Q2RRX0_9ACTN|nr:glycosyltransferase [Nocardioides oleivorans]RYB91687.1 glycosyltransferase [Nocardioides oleivorans]